MLRMLLPSVATYGIVSGELMIRDGTVVQYNL
jgi:hypothetical protein